MKITCASCKNEKDKFCLVKKIGIAINKRRNCNKYVLDPSKVKEKQVIKTIKMSYKEREALRAHYKEQLKKAKSMGLDSTAEINYKSSDPKHPITGDLSRFTSTVDNSSEE